MRSKQECFCNHPPSHCSQASRPSLSSQPTHYHKTLNTILS